MRVNFTKHINHDKSVVTHILADGKVIPSVTFTLSGPVGSEEIDIIRARNGKEDMKDNHVTLVRVGPKNKKG